MISCFQLGFNELLQLLNTEVIGNRAARHGNLKIPMRLSPRKLALKLLKSCTYRGKVQVSMCYYKNVKASPEIVSRSLCLGEGGSSPRLRTLDIVQYYNNNNVVQHRYKNIILSSLSPRLLASANIIYCVLMIYICRVYSCAQGREAR